MNTKKLILCVVAGLVFWAQLALAAGKPENVSGVEAVAIDSASIGLTWKAAKDAEGGLVDHYRIYYGAKSVFEAGEGDYEKQVDTTDNKNSYVVTGLTPNTTYYFSVTAFSSDKIESGEYSLEASAKTPAAEGAPVATEDKTAPTVTNVSAPDKQHVKVIFSEAVQLPAEAAQTAFTITEQLVPTKTLEVKKAAMDATDTTNKTVTLETADQTENLNYIVTAGIAVKDAAGNPIVSGSTDSGLFLGSANAPAEQIAAGVGEEGGEGACAALQDKIKSCEKYTCKFKSIVGITSMIEIIGKEGDRCHMEESFTLNDEPAGKFVCKVTSNSKDGLVKYYEVAQMFKSMEEYTAAIEKGDIKIDTKYKLDGEDIDLMDLHEALVKKGECIEQPAANKAAPEAKACVNNMACFLPNLKECALANVSESDTEYTYKMEVTKADGDNCVIKYTADKHPNALFAASSMECKIAKGTYEKTEDYRKAFDLKNCIGDLVAGYKAIEVKDTTPPENVTKLLLTFRAELEKFVVMLSWTPSLNTAKDLVDQLLYMSLDRGTTYDTGKSLGAEAVTTEVTDLEAGKEYTFKVTTKDAAGNESTGAVKSIRLPQTGMGIGLILLGSAFAARRIMRKKEENVL